MPAGDIATAWNFRTEESQRASTDHTWMPGRGSGNRLLEAPATHSMCGFVFTSSRQDNNWPYCLTGLHGMVSCQQECLMVVWRQTNQGESQTNQGESPMQA